jgi:hypothetical protein
MAVFTISTLFPFFRLVQTDLKGRMTGASQFLSSLSVPKEPSKLARHFNAGTGWENPESRRDG